MATKKAPLRAVKDGETRKRKLTITEAADDGDRLKLLVALRSRIAKTVEDPNTPARDLAALSRRLLEVAKEIEAIESVDDEDDVSQAADTPDEAWVAK